MKKTETVGQPKLAVEPRASSHFCQNDTVFERKQYGSFPHLLSAPELDFYDFALFSKMELKLKRHLFDTVNEIQTESQKIFCKLF